VSALCAIARHPNYRAHDASGGEYHSLVLMQDGSLWGCGEGADGQLGIGSTADNWTLSEVLGGGLGTAHLQNVTSFDAGWYHSLAVASDAVQNRYVAAWGRGNYGQLGNGSIGIICPSPVKVHGGEMGSQYLQNITAVSAGRSGQHSLAAEAMTGGGQGRVFAWGLNSMGQCGNGIKCDSLQTPVKVLTDPNTSALLTNVVQVEAGIHHSAALDRNGHAWTWGKDGSDVAHYVDQAYAKPVRDSQDNWLPALTDIGVCVGTIALDENGFVWRWGDGISEPNKVPGGEMGSEFLQNIVAVAAGHYTYMALDSNGNVWTWASIVDIEPVIFLGNDDEPISTTPVKVHDGQMNAASGYLEDIVAIDAGFEHWLAVDKRGQVWAWGQAGSGRLGDEAGVNASSPVRMIMPSGPSSLEITMTASPGDRCLRPDDWPVEDSQVTYTISYSNCITNPNNPSYGTLQNVRVTDCLPRSVTFLSADEPNDYNSVSHTVTWSIGTLAPGAGGTITLTVEVNPYAKPGGTIRNTALLETDSCAAQADANTPICYYGGPVIYVDPNATGFDNGTSWGDAFKSLSEAMASAWLCDCDAQLWLKQGTHRPGTTVNVGNNMSIYGGFAGTEPTVGQRPTGDGHVTTISGDTNGDGTADVGTLMAIEDVNNVTVDGVTFAKCAGAGVSLVDEVERNSKVSKCRFAGATQGISCDFADTVISGCTFEGDSTGVYATNWSWPRVEECTFLNNSVGISLNGASPWIIGCDIGPGNGVGISCVDFSSSIENSLIHENSAGVVCENSAVVDLTNCSIQNNSGAGIESYYAYPSIVSCDVVWNGTGVTASHSDVQVEHSVIAANSQVGIAAVSSSLLTVTGSSIRDNSSHGIRCSATNDLTLTNNWICHNGVSGGYGIDIENIVCDPTVRNNTIANNGSGGIYRSGTMYPPNVLNCVFWNNGTNGDVDTSGTFGSISYCRRSTNGGTNGNITSDPCFVDPCGPDYHLKVLSACIDAGLTIDDCYWEPDIEMEDRVFDGNYDGVAKVDMGADEYYRSRGDLNADECVNFLDYAFLMSKWLNTCTAGNQWCSGADINHSLAVNGADLYFVAKDWLWETAEPRMPGCDVSLLPQQQSQQQQMMMDNQMVSSGMESQSVVAVEDTITPEQFQETIDFLSQIAVDDPASATAIYEIIRWIQEDYSSSPLTSTPTDQ
jgi:uncharacterized repeat protein (TIGR01451 family)